MRTNAVNCIQADGDERRDIADMAGSAEYLRVSSVA